MKSIGIYTLYNSKNFGAFLQAYALKTFLEDNYNCNVYFIENNVDKSTINFFDLKRFKKNIYYSIQNYKFNRSYKNFIVIKKNDYIYNDIDTFIFGSDEIWNVKNKYFIHDDDFFGIANKRSISYACSCNESTYDDILKIYGKTAFDNFEKISVRDDSTLKIVKKFKNSNIIKVLDPTFLISYDKYLKNVKFKNYILIYGYHFTKEQIDKIKKFALIKKLKTISIGQYQSWCDKNIYGDAFDFLSYINSCDYFITTTFHGCIFSVILNKKFGVFVNDNIKVKEFIKDMKLECAIIDNIDNIDKSLEKVHNIKPDTLISKKYIKDSIEE